MTLRQQRFGVCGSELHLPDGNDLLTQIKSLLPARRVVVRLRKFVHGIERIGML